MSSIDEVKSGGYVSFSHSEYRHILRQLMEYLPILDYSEIDQNTESFCVIRHDVEFSLDRALELARIEHEMNINTSYFIQLNNDTYNPLSSKGIEIIHEISKLGHKIGLHFTPSSAEHNIIVEEFNTLKAIFYGKIGFNIDRFSFHRPNLNVELLSNKIRIDGLINVYDDLFFEFFDGEIPDKPRVKYVSDSNHKWKYGSPLEAIDDGCRKLHILFHPFSWSEEGGNNLDNYLSLIKEKNHNLINSIDAEMSNFPLDEIIKKLEI